MKKLTLKHEINCSVDHFWKVFFDQNFNTSLFRDELGFPKYDIVSQDETDAKITRVVKGTPKMDMPKPIMKLLGDGFSYEESGTFDKGKSLWVWKMKPSTLADKVRNEGTVTCEKISDDRCRRIATIEMEAKIFGVGGLMESSTEKEFRKGWDASAVYMNKWIKDHPPE